MGERAEACPSRRVEETGSHGRRTIREGTGSGGPRRRASKASTGIGRDGGRTSQSRRRDERSSGATVGRPRPEDERARTEHGKQNVGASREERASDSRAHRCLSGGISKDAKCDGNVGSHDRLHLCSSGEQVKRSSGGNSAASRARRGQGTRTRKAKRGAVT